jgi:hypothetical protein
MRAADLLCCALLAGLLGACAKPGGEAAANALPADWPVPRLTIPSGGKVFEGRKDDKGAASTDYTVYFTDTQPWDGVVGDVKSKLKPLGYFEVQDKSADAAGGARDDTFAAPDGSVIIFLSYEESADSQQHLGVPGYYTLLVQKLKAPVPIGADWQKL